MPRLTLVPPTPQRPPPCPTDDVCDIIDELTAARDGLTDGPAVLSLVNELMRSFEFLFEDGQTRSAGRGSMSLASKNFLSRLTGFAENIRRSNGEISDEFLAFLRTTPSAMGDYTTN